METRREEMSTALTHTIDIVGNWRDEFTQEWAGTGRCNPTTGEIECAAELEGKAYDEISDQLTEGQVEGEVTVQGSEYPITYKWSIEDAK